MDIMNKILKPFKCGDSLVLSLTSFIKENTEYLVYNDGNNVIIKEFKR